MNTFRRRFGPVGDWRFHVDFILMWVLFCCFLVLVDHFQKHSLTDAWKFALVGVIVIAIAPHRLLVVWGTLLFAAFRAAIAAVSSGKVVHIVIFLVASSLCWVLFYRSKSVASDSDSIPKDLKTIDYLISGSIVMLALQLLARLNRG